MTCQDAAHAGYAMEAASSTPLSSSSRRRKGQPRKCVDSTLALTESSTSVSSVASNDSGLHSSSSLSLSDVTPTTSFSSVLPEVLIQSLVGSSDGIFQQLKQFEGGDELTSFMTVHPPPTTTSSPVLPIQKSGSVVFPANGKNGVKMEACLPERFQRILNDANGSSDSPGYSNGVEVLQRKRKEPGRCETKATLQAADGTILEGNYDAEELQSFVKNFKLLRNKHGFTQGDVGMALGRRYGADFSQTTISRFEALNLSFKNMCKLRPLLEEWLDEVEKAVERGVVPTDLLLCDSSPPAFADGSGQASGSTSPELRLQPVQASRLNAKIVPPLKKRRKRTNLDAMQKTALDAFFVRNPRPDYSQIQEIADSLGLDNDVVRVWFCNRRQKVRKTE